MYICICVYTYRYRYRYKILSNQLAKFQWRHSDHCTSRLLVVLAVVFNLVLKQEDNFRGSVRAVN